MLGEDVARLAHSLGERSWEGARIEGGLDRVPDRVKVARVHDALDGIVGDDRHHALKERDVEHHAHTLIRAADPQTLEPRGAHPLDVAGHALLARNKAHDRGVGVGDGGEECEHADHHAQDDGWVQVGAGGEDPLAFSVFKDPHEDECDGDGDGQAEDIGDPRVAARAGGNYDDDLGAGFLLGVKDRVLDGSLVGFGER